MPPKVKFTKQQIISTALDVVRKEGADGLTARSLSGQLGCSVCPIFTLFESMSEVQNEVIRSASSVYERYIHDGDKDTPKFKAMGKGYIKFAQEEPNLFRLLFMNSDTSLPFIATEPDKGEITGILQKVYCLDSIETAERLHMHMWVYVHGFASMCASGVCVFPDEQIDGMLSEAFTGIIERLKRGDKE